MSKKHLYIILFVIAILGLSVVQYQYFRIGLNLAGVQFNEKMGEAIEDIKADLKGKNDLTFLVGSAITKNDSNFRLSLDSLQDASVYFFNDFLNKKLLQKGIKTDFSFVIYDTDSIQYLHSEEVDIEADNLLKYPVALEGYLPDMIGKKLNLELHFENVNRYFLSQLNGLTIPSILFLIIIILVILWVYRSLNMQHDLIMTTNEFVNNLTHELKTPVFSIGVATKILEEKGHKEDQKIAEIIRTQVEKLKNQIDKVLELGIIEGKKNFITKKMIDAKPMLDKIAEDYKLFGELIDIEFESDIEEDKFIVNADLYHLENAINSLLENARKYSNEKAKIEFFVHKSQKYLEISIRDDGIGIEESELKNIFEKYYRVSHGDLHAVKGYGLGLNYVKRIVHLHKGRIEVESTIDKGSTFKIKIPLVRNGK